MDDSPGLVEQDGQAVVALKMKMLMRRRLVFPLEELPSYERVSRSGRPHFLGEKACWEECTRQHCFGKQLEAKLELDWESVGGREKPAVAAAAEVVVRIDPAPKRSDTWAPSSQPPYNSRYSLHWALAANHEGQSETRVHCMRPFVDRSLHVGPNLSVLFCLSHNYRNSGVHLLSMLQRVGLRMLPDHHETSRKDDRTGKSQQGDSPNLCAPIAQETARDVEEKVAMYTADL